MSRTLLVFGILLVCSLLSHVEARHTKPGSPDNSTELQIDLPANLFLDRDSGFSKFFEFISELSNANPVLEMKLTTAGEAEYMLDKHYDTSSDILHHSNIRISFRALSTPDNLTVYSNETYFKFESLIYAYVYAAPAGCNYKKYDCYEKVEQDVHQNYSRFSHESKATPAKFPESSITGGEFADYFPGFLQFNGLNDTATQYFPENSTKYYYRTKNIGLSVGGYAMDTTVDCVYSDEQDMINGGVVPDGGVALSIRYYNDDLIKAGDLTHVIRRADFLYWLILNSDWNADRFLGHGDSGTWNGFWGDI